MPNRVYVDSQTPAVVREFSLYEPMAWQWWVQKAWDAGEAGLPVLFVLHDRGDNPETFQAAWPFREVWDRVSPNAPTVQDGDKTVTYRELANQFFLVYLYGYSPADRPAVVPSELRSYDEPSTRGLGLVTVPGGATPTLVTEVNDVLLWGRDLATTARVLGQDTAKVASGMRFLRKACWNPGPFVPNPAPQDDVQFVREVFAALDRWLTPRMGRIVRASDGAELTTPFDARRYYLMGVGDGAMLGYRLIKEMPGTWAALHAMGGSIGGQLFADGRGPGTLTDNSPDPSDARAKPVSLYAHHGGQVNTQPRSLNDADWHDQNDLTIPPGPPVVAPNPYTPLTGTTEIEALVNTGVMSLGDAGLFAPAYDPLQKAVDAVLALDPSYALSNDLRNQPDRTTPPPASGFPWPPGTATIRTWTSTAVGGSAPPEVVEHRDERMNHTNYLDPVTTLNPYITVDTIWSWLYAHPRVT